jgi:hypothetical protein
MSLSCGAASAAELFHLRRPLPVWPDPKMEWIVRPWILNEIRDRTPGREARSVDVYSGGAHNPPMMAAEERAPSADGHEDVVDLAGELVVALVRSLASDP